MLDKQIKDIPKKVLWCKNCCISNQRPRIIFDENQICSACKHANYKSTINWQIGSSVDNKTFQISASGITDDGTVIASIDVGMVDDLAGNSNIASTSTDNNVEVDTSAAYGVIDTLYHTIAEKKNDDPKKSYTAKLLQGKQNSMLKKIVEEAGEFTFAVKDNDTEEMIYEGADLMYHCLVALASKNISPDRIKQELTRRFGLSGIEEKNSRVEG